MPAAWPWRVLMLPTVILTAEEAIRMVPAQDPRSGHRHGGDADPDRLARQLPTAMPGILTGVMLAVARAAGETAPLIFTACFSNYWPVWDNGLTEPARPRWPC